MLWSWSSCCSTEPLMPVWTEPKLDNHKLYEQYKKYFCFISVIHFSCSQCILHSYNSYFNKRSLFFSNILEAIFSWQNLRTDRRDMFPIRRAEETYIWRYIIRGDLSASTSAIRLLTRPPAIANHFVKQCSIILMACCLTECNYPVIVIIFLQKSKLQYFKPIIAL